MYVLRKRSAIAAFPFRRLSLFGIKGLKAPNDFPRLASQAINAAQKELDSLPSISCIHERVRVLDRISNHLCSVIDPAELCRNIHPATEYIAGAEEAFSMISEFISQLNSNVEVYGAIRKIVDNSSTFDLLSDEEKMLLHDLRREFDTNGIHLQELERRKLALLVDEITELESMFMRNINSLNSETFTLGPMSQESSSIKQWIRNSSPQSFAIGDVVTCSKNHAISNILLEHLETSATRQCLWVNTADEPSSNKMVLCKLVQLRQALAIDQGFASYSHKFLQDKAIKSTENAMSFLSQIASQTDSKGKEVMSLLGSPAPWDVNYRIKQFKQSDASLRNRSKALTALSSYFSVNRCIEGLRHVTFELFGINLSEEKFMPYESWMTGMDASEFGPRKFLVKSVGNELLGVLYLDIWQRQGKFPGNAHFTIQCGCKSAAALSMFSNANNDFQLPVIAVVLNFPRVPNKNLTLLELETLYHEWGHALHSILSKSQFQHLSGTRGALDFAEIPSHLFEYFSRTPSVVTQWARHNNDSSAPSLSLLEDALEYRNPLAIIDVQTQLLYSLADQYIFGPQCVGLSHIDTEIVYSKMVKGICEVQAKHTCLPVGIIGNQLYPAMKLTSHSHFINYGGGYYCYLFAKAYAAQIWSSKLAKKPLDREAGDFLSQAMLVHGGSKSPADILANVTGPLDVSHYLKSII